MSWGDSRDPIKRPGPMRCPDCQGEMRVSPPDNWSCTICGEHFDGQELKGQNRLEKWT